MSDTDASSGGGDGTVLVVDDDDDLADTCRFWLRDDWDVHVAYDGNAALDAYDPSVDVVLLDRRMPVVSGDEVLRRLRDRAGDPRVAMMTAVEPSDEIADMSFDEYLVKPVERERLRETVRALYARRTYDEDLRELYAVSAKIASLSGNNASVGRVETVERLRERRAELMDATVDARAELDFEDELRELDDDEGLGTFGLQN